MKKRIFLIAFALLLILMIFNIATSHMTGVKAEKDWYLSRLDFDFSGIVEAPEKPGQALFHVTHGEIDLEKEARLKAELHFNGMLDLFLYREDGLLDLMIPGDIHLQQGDSVYINTHLKIARFYRSDSMIFEHSLLQSMRGRPF